MKMTFPAKDRISLSGLKSLTPAIAASGAGSIRTGVSEVGGTEKRTILSSSTKKRRA